MPWQRHLARTTEGFRAQPGRASPTNVTPSNEEAYKLAYIRGPVPVETPIPREGPAETRSQKALTSPHSSRESEDGRPS